VIPPTLEQKPVAEPEQPDYDDGLEEHDIERLRYLAENRKLA